MKLQDVKHKYSFLSVGLILIDISGSFYPGKSPVEVSEAGQE